MKIGDKLKYLREERKLKQGTIAELIGVKINTYSQYENNLRTPNYDSIKKIAEYYEVTTDFLLDEQFDEKFAFVDHLLTSIKILTFKLLKLFSIPKEEMSDWSQEKLAKYDHTIRVLYDKLTDTQKHLKSALALLGIDDSILDDYMIIN